MAWGAVAVGAGTVIGGVLASNAQKSAAKAAANAQTKAASEGIAFERERLAQEKQIYDQNMAEYQRKQQLLERQQEQTRTMLAPYMQAGQGALYEMMALTGMAAPTALPTPTYTAQQAPSLIQQAREQASQPTYGQRQTARQYQTQQGQMIPLANVSQMMVQPSSSALAGSRMDQEELQKLLFDRERLRRSGAYGSDMINPDYKKKMDQAYEYAQYLDKQSAQAQQQEQAALDIENQRMAALQQTSPYAGMTGSEAQTAAIEKISQSPILQELMKQGEQSMLQSASATGGLRGGNTQAALAQFRPRMIQDEIERQYSRLQGLSSIGQQSILGAPTTNVPSQPSYSGVSQIPSLYGDIGSAQAGQAIAAGQAQGQLYSGIGTGLGYLGYGLANREKSPTSPYADYYPGL